jgi:hypothetical protein
VPGLVLWNSVKGSNRREELEVHLKQHPNGRSVELPGRGFP